MSGSLTVRLAGADDAPTVASALAVASLDEAVLAWVVPDERARRDRVTSGAEQTLAWVHGVLATGEVLVAQVDSGVIAGLSLWEFDNGDPVGTDPAELSAFLARAYGEYAPRMALVHELTRRRHPRGEPHWYLQQMVVVPDHRGRGLGGAMLSHQLARADAAGVAAYLEASSPRNRRLYERHGFRALGGPITLPDGPGVQPMWRPAATPAEPR
ncbi:GNAT family N-acetyltransferase [Micromonospora sp. NBC_01699]|uniref:GNAT family N-acetyltransferase n=1 Tax=Micromonospora sp. NBC_01699 TaxID=2975984 RepID=UPI002E35C473|nr:GNAT family N-acetyltransferase [Micromonospora sp. NBC_01699]